MLRMYDELVPWYRLLDPTEDHREETASYRAAFERTVIPEPRTLLELGAGAGNNAFHLKRAFQCTLSDISEPMLALSRDLNPDCEHILGDLRTLRLDRTFDAVLVHDAIVYMTSETDLRAAIETAFVHTRPDGAAIFAPDCLRETFTEQSELYEGDDGQRALRCVEWSWDPDPADDTCRVDYAFLVRDGTEIRAVHDSHIEGMFARARWHELLSDVGFRVETIQRPVTGSEAADAYTDEVFLGVRPADR